MAMSKLEIALRMSLVNPRVALARIARIQSEQFAAVLRTTSDVELAFIGEVVERLDAKAGGKLHRLEGIKRECMALAKAFSGAPLKLTEGEREVLEDLRARREAGEIPLDRRQHRATEGWWGFLNLLRSFARGNGLPQPAIDHRLNAYREQVARDLFVAYSVTATAPGLPLSSWAEDDRAAMMEVWDLVDTTPPVIIRRPPEAAPVVSQERRARGDGPEAADVIH